MELTFYRYQIPFKQPFTTAAGTFRKREGIFPVLNHNKLRALGEAAPLPGFSPETLDETIRWATQNLSLLEEFIGNQIRTTGQPMQSFSGDIPASLSFALDTLVVDYRSQAAGQPVRNFLFPDRKPLSKISINATLPIGDVDSSLAKAKDLVGKGYNTLKLKVGQNAEQEIFLIKKLRDRFPGINLRLDANQGWSVNAAINQLAQLKETDIEYCEEPVAEPTVEKLKTIKNATGIRLALDESLYNVPDPLRWIGQKAADILIIKPMIVGSFQMIKQLCKTAGSHDMVTVFTTSLESGVGRMMTANLASALGSKELAHGLATGSMLKEDLLEDNRFIKDGEFHLPDQAGIGTQLDPQKQSLKLQKLEV